ncbi:hypothetical protein GCM10022244_23590 [Streptomyces gulbargensis]|uniref:Uncharacterized protein n=1 Tax=Streptomyces gulbargensis TaxID=364901 RepID=A0ABP7M3V3_9ACTN
MKKRPPGPRSDGCAGDKPSAGTARLGNNARKHEHPDTTRKPHGPKAS